MKHNIPILYHFSGPTLESAITRYKGGIAGILNDLSQDGQEYMIKQFEFLIDPIEKRYIVMAAVIIDEMKMDRKNIMDMAKKAIGQAGITGNPNCDHDFENTPDGLVCSKCGGTLG